MERQLLSVLRDRSAPIAKFRNASDRLARLLCAKTLSLLGSSSGKPARIETPGGTPVPRNVMIVPVIRAAMALVPAFTEMIPDAPVGIVGVERCEETSEPHLYYNKLPQTLPEMAVIIDPMLATGGTACLVTEMLLERGYERSDIYYTGVLAAPEGMRRLSKIIPRPNIVVAAVDQGLDEQDFIVPGLGDYGDRYYGT